MLRLWSTLSFPPCLPASVDRRALATAAVFLVAVGAEARLPASLGTSSLFSNTVPSSATAAAASTGWMPTGWIATGWIATGWIATGWTAIEPTGQAGSLGATRMLLRPARLALLARANAAVFGGILLQFDALCPRANGNASRQARLPELL
eukprot:scaffold55756_cov66-Phaeocystis_antarctica.AAC.2